MLCLRRLAGEGAVLARQLEQGASTLWSKAPAKAFSQARPSIASNSDTAWRTLQEQGFEVNPCGSKFHPAVKMGLVPSVEDVEEVKSLQEAYAPWSTCFGCGALQLLVCNVSMACQACLIYHVYVSTRSLLQRSRAYWCAFRFLARQSEHPILSNRMLASTSCA